MVGSLVRKVADWRNQLAHHLNLLKCELQSKPAEIVKTKQSKTKLVWRDFQKTRAALMTLLMWVPGLTTLTQENKAYFSLGIWGLFSSICFTSLLGFLLLVNWRVFHIASKSQEWLVAGEASEMPWWGLLFQLWVFAFLQYKSLLLLLLWNF